jgi:hypothetical protein
VIQYTTLLHVDCASGTLELPIGQRGDFGFLGATKRHARTRGFLPLPQYL